MIYIPIGTKAQLIKMAPIIREAENQQLDFKFILTGQHAETMDELMQVFQLRKPDDFFIQPEEADSYGKLLKWLMKAFFSAFAVLKRDNNDLVLVHGDTLSTLLCAIVGRLKGMTVVHIEAGLRSDKLLNPFPEEITRRLVTLLSGYFVVQDDQARNNLKRIPDDKILNSHGNTMLDALVYAKNNIDLSEKTERFAIASLHRNENINVQKNFDFLMRSVIQASGKAHIKFILHPVTKRKLDDSEWKEQLLANDIELLERMDYVAFTKLMLQAEFLITDGGSNQEEASYMGLPCLIMRKSTERVEGLDENAILSLLREDTVADFLDNYADFRRPMLTQDKTTVSTSIVDFIRSI